MSTLLKQVQWKNGLKLQKRVVEPGMLSAYSATKYDEIAKKTKPP